MSTVTTTPDKASKSHLIEEAILPTWINQRTISALGYVWLWIGMAVIIATFQLGASGVAGLSLTSTLVTIALANLLLGVVMALTADIGTEHGLSFAVYLRAPFGVVGTHLPSVSRGIVAAIWFGINTYLGALALNGIIGYLTGFENWPLWYGLFAVLQIANTALGIRAVEKLAAVAAPAIVAISVWMYFSLTGVAETEGVNIWTFAGDTDIDIVALFVANMAFWSTLAVDIPNITRFLKVEPGTRSYFKRNKHVWAAQFLALPVTQTWIALIGAVSFIVADDWNPINVIQEQGSGLTLVVLLIMVLLAQWSTNNSANLIPAALTFVNAGAPHVSYAMALVIAGVVGTLAMPWLILNNLFFYLGLYGAVLSAVGGIMVCDYFLVRKRRLNVPDLYRADGQFSYSNGVNPAGVIAWAVGGGGAMLFVDYAYLIGFPLAFAVYYAMMRFWVTKRFPQAEIENPQDGQFLATSVGMNWVHGSAGFKRLATAEIPADTWRREDL